jgi:RNA polymerase sigma factor (sigma-70 family)
MSAPPAEAAVRPLRRLIWRRAAGAVPDDQLWERFRTDREEAAFEALVRRHGPMVLGVCRRVLRDRHDAEDAFQATFLVLVRKAGAITRPELLGNWLYGVAYNTARNARLSRSRRAAAEARAAQSATADSPRPPADADPRLDEELSRLPDKYRLPVVLCALHGESREEAARRLGCPEGTLSSRLARARELLQRRLERRGVTAGAALATLFGGGLAVAGVPAPLVASTARICLTHPAGPAVALPVLSLAEGVMKTMWLKQSTAALAATLVAGLVVGTALDSDRALAQKPTKPDKPAATKAGDKVKPELGPTVRGKVHSTDSTKKQITVSVPKNDGTKATEEKAFQVAADAAITLDSSPTKQTPQAAGKLADLSDGTDVSVQLAADKTTAVAIHAHGPNLHARIAATDTGKNTLTLRTKGADGPEEQTVTLHKDAKILMSDGLTKEEKPKEATLADLAVETGVVVHLSSDRQTALGVRILGAHLLGNVKSVDADARTVTLTVKEDGQLVDKTLTLVKDARIEGAKLADLQAGTPVTVTLSVFDQSQAAVVRVREE